MANYGTSERTNGQQNGAHDEERATLLYKPKSQALSRRLYGHLTVKINRHWGDIPLLICYIVTGLLDSSAVSIFGCFVSMQTGNTIYLGLGLVEPQADNRWIRSIASIISFCAGSFFFSRFHQYFVPHKRWVLMMSYLMQMLLIMAGALCVTFGPKLDKDGPITPWIMVPLCLVAFQSAGQAITSRVLKFNGVTSVVLTSNYCDLFNDAKLFTSGFTENPERNRRLVAPFLLLLGAYLGGVFARSDIGLAGALWVAVGVKSGMVLAWLFWPAEPESDT